MSSSRTPRTLRKHLGEIDEVKAMLRELCADSDTTDGARVRALACFIQAIRLSASLVKTNFDMKTLTTMDRRLKEFNELQMARDDIIPPEWQAPLESPANLVDCDDLDDDEGLH